MPAVTQPFVGQAPVRNDAPAANEWGQVTRPVLDVVEVEGVAGGTPVEVTGTFTVTPEARPTTSDVQEIAAVDATTTLAAANADRRGLLVYNDSTRALYVKLGDVASVNSWTVKLYEDDCYELPSPVYVGIVTGIWEAGVGGRAIVTEMRP